MGSPGDEYPRADHSPRSPGSQQAPSAEPTTLLDDGRGSSVLLSARRGLRDSQTRGYMASFKTFSYLNEFVWNLHFIFVCLQIMS